MTASPHAIAAFKLGMVLAVLATTTVGLRFLAKRRTRMELGPDDWCVFVALVFMGGFMVTSGMRTSTRLQNGTGWDDLESFLLT